METTSYCRVSMEDQVKEGVSLTGQEARVRAYCAVAGLSLVESIRDKGVSTVKLPATRLGWDGTVSAPQRPVCRGGGLRCSSRYGPRSSRPRGCW
jgi:hypothetical protein